MFSVIQIPDEPEFHEQMGTKFKFWYEDPLLGRTLFKQGRPGTGENWAEKLSCEFATMLGIPHANYELALWRGLYGTCSPSFVPTGGRLIHGNELLGGKVTRAEDKTFYYAERSHTTSAVLGLLKIRDMVEAPFSYAQVGQLDQAIDVFVGYLLFDAWVGNQDRHAENWGFVRLRNNFYLAPSYDHGSSLARNINDVERADRIRTRDRGYSVDHYVTTARSSLYPFGAQRKTRPLLTHEAFEHGWKASPRAGDTWRERLASITTDHIRGAINMVPDELMSDMAKEFTHRLLISNQIRLLALKLTQ